MRQPGQFKKTLRVALGGSLVAALLVLDMTGNFITGGSWDETISSRAGRTRDISILADALCTVLDVIDEHHCDKAAKDGSQAPRQ